MPSGLCEAWVPVNGPSDRKSSPLAPAPGSSPSPAPQPTGNPKPPRPRQASASQTSRSEVTHFVKYLPPISPETPDVRSAGGGCAGRNARPGGKQREAARGAGQAPAAGRPHGPAAEGFGETGAGGRRIRREERRTGVRPELGGAAAPFLSPICRVPGGQSPAGNRRPGDRRRGVRRASPHARHRRAGGARSWGRRRGNRRQALGQPQGAPRNGEKLDGVEASWKGQVGVGVSEAEN